MIQLEQSGNSQISTTDSDARAFHKKGQGTIVGYNAQLAVEASSKMILSYQMTNEGDINAFHQIAKQAADFLLSDQDKTEGKTINGLADKGYDNGEQIKKATEDNIVTYIAPRQYQSKKPEAYRKDKFVYNLDSDTHTCPAGQCLTTNGKLYETTKNGNTYCYKTYQVKQSICQPCSFGQLCAGADLKNKKGRKITRSQYEDYRDQNKKRVNANKELYKQRQAIVEHPFGTIKRQWGFDHTLVKGIENVAVDFSLICTAYNLRRAISILGVEKILKAINGVESFIFLLLSQKNGRRVSREYLTIFDFVNYHSFQCSSQKPWIA